MINILELKENEDGSAVILLEVSAEELRMFAEIGLRQILIDAANEVIKSGAE